MDRKKLYNSLLKTGAVVLIGGWCVGCKTVGPDYSRPKLVEPDVSELLDGSENKSMSSVIDSKMLSEWWNCFDDQVMVDLINKAFENNNDFKSAIASLREARAKYGIADSATMGRVDMQTGAYKQNNGLNTGRLHGETDSFSLGFDASWEADLFGGVRRSVEAASADLESEIEKVNYARVSLAAEVAICYTNLRTYQHRLKTAKSNLRIQTQTLEMAKSRYDSGLSDELAVMQAMYSCESTRAVIPSLAVKVEENMNSIALLTGVVPGKLHQLLEADGSIPVSELSSVTEIPVDFLRQRADVKRAERSLAAQNARIGVATSELYPKLVLSGSIGLETINSTTFLDYNSLVRSIGPTLALPIFRGGAIRENIEVQEAVYDRMLQSYYKTVLTAVKEVRDALVGFKLEKQRYDALKAAVVASGNAADVSKDKYKNGLIDFNSVLDAERSQLSLQEQLVISEGAISTNLIRLYKALGGGWNSQ
jgi:NodT family efflux transporter outer membrane factor (OMF) lipoprotein